MTDYIGKYVKKFESGSVGSLNLCSSGNDWGLSCGSYALTLRWGNCINFLKKYFPSESSSLFFNTSWGDFASKTWPGNTYCSSPEAVKSVWQKCYNKVGASVFFEYEHAYIESICYIPIKNKIKDILDLDILNDRAYQECFWSWSVHRGVSGCYNEFMDVLFSNDIDSLDYVDREVLFDLIYDKRYNITGYDRYKKDLMNGSSERETLRPLLTKGTISGKTPVVIVDDGKRYTVQVGAYSQEQYAEQEIRTLNSFGFNNCYSVLIGRLYKIWVGENLILSEAECLQTQLNKVGVNSILVEYDRSKIEEKHKEPEMKINELHGTLKVIIRDDTLNVRSSPDFGDNIVTAYPYGTILTVIGITENSQFYKLSDGNFISTNKNYVQFTETKEIIGYTVRVKASSIPIKKEPKSSSTTVGTIYKNSIYTIVDEENGYGKLKSGAGWISLDSNSVTKLS